MWFIPIIQTGTDYVGCASDVDGYDYSGDIGVFYLSDTTYGEKECLFCGYEMGNYCPDDPFTSTDIPFGSCHDNEQDYPQYVAFETDRKVNLLSDGETFIIPDGWLLEVFYNIQGYCGDEVAICQTHPLRPYELVEYADLHTTAVYINAMMYKPDGNCQDIIGLDTCTFIDDCDSRYRACGDGSLVYPFYNMDDGDDDSGDDDDDDDDDDNFVDESGAIYPFTLDSYFFML